MAMAIFDHAHPKIIEVTISFPQFDQSVTRLGTSIFDHAHQKKFWSTFNLCTFVSTCKKLDYFTDLF